MPAPSALAGLGAAAPAPAPASSSSSSSSSSSASSQGRRGAAAAAAAAGARTGPRGVVATSGAGSDAGQGESQVYAAVKDLVAGTFGGFAQVAAGHPLDTIKVRLQTQAPDPATGKMPYAGMMDCARKTFAEEGAAGLYKGAASPLVGAAIHNAGVFFAYGQSKKLTGADQRGAPIPTYFYAGGIAAVPVSAIEAPVDLFKVKLQSQVGKGQYSGVFDAARKIVGKYGVRGAYQGFGATVIRNVPCFASYFAASEYGFRLVNPPESLEPVTYGRAFLGGLVGGSLAGFAFWGVFYPLETIKSRMQSDADEPALRKYKSWVDCYRKTMAEGGVASFYRGYVPAIVRAVPVNAAIFCVVFSVKNALS